MVQFGMFESVSIHKPLSTTPEWLISTSGACSLSRMPLFMLLVSVQISCGVNPNILNESRLGFARAVRIGNGSQTGYRVSPSPMVKSVMQRWATLPRFFGQTRTHHASS